ncbi:MFS transporter [Streptomyces cyaneofuscatus]|uniref:MFS transporter n=1 Tax=Streptomyces cyaneofuscatus TaxID=66883 RepID=UPI003694AA5C
MLIARIGKRTAPVTCHLLVAAGLLLLLPVASSGGVGWYITSTVLAGVGYGISFSLVAETAVAAVPAERAGSAAVIAETSNELGNALGIALLGSLSVLVFRLQGPDLAGTFGGTLGLPGLAPAVIDQAKDAFVTDLRVVAVTAALLHVVLGLVTLRRLPNALEVEGGAGPGGKGSKAAVAEAVAADGARKAAMP